MLPRFGAGADGGVVHEHGDVAEGRRLFVEARELGGVPDVGRDGVAAEGRGGGRQRVTRQVGQHDAHAQRAELAGAGKADAAGGAGDHGDMAGKKGGMGHGVASPCSPGN